MRIDQRGAHARPASRLCVACMLPARLPCRAQAAAHRHGPPMAKAWPRWRTGLDWAPPRRSVLTGGKIFGENMARKIDFNLLFE